MTALYLHSSPNFLGYESLPRFYKQLETGMENFQEASESVCILAQIDFINLVSEGEKEALEWIRKYLEFYSPEVAEIVIRDDNTGLKGLSERTRARALEYLVTKGDERYIEIVSQYANDTLVRLLKIRVAGMNVFDSSDFGVLGYWGGMFIPSVTNTGPQAVYVREILYRYWEEHGRDSSKIPQELQTMVVSFDENGNPVSSVDLAKYGLTMPVIEPRPHRDIFNWWNEITFGGSPVKLTVKFPDLAEPVEITPYMCKRNSPDWEGLYIHVPKKGGATASPPSRDEESGVEDKGRATTSRLAAPGTASPYLLCTAILATLCAGIAVWLLRRRGKK